MDKITRQKGLFSSTMLLLLSVSDSSSYKISILLNVQDLRCGSLQP
uniref:Uncharacterized protein n=1 Tax=Anguilla anguilla TaxID=7936 RepID=A0A0E9WZ03_ANGAN